MGCSSSKSSDVRSSQIGSVPGSLHGIRRKAVLPSGRSAKRNNGKDARKVHQNADVQQPALCPASWPELNVLLCKLKQETPMFNASCGATTLREIINTPELAPGLRNNIDDRGDGKIEPPSNTRPRRSRRTMSVSVIHTVEDVDAAMRRASDKTWMHDDFSVDYREDRGLAENDMAPARMDSSGSAVVEPAIGRKDRSPSFNGNYDGGDRLESTGDLGAPVFDPETLDAFESAAEEAAEEVSENERPSSGGPTADEDSVQAKSNDSYGIKPMSRAMVAPEKSQLAEDLLESFECRCPPNGEHKAVLYTTSLRGIRKTYEDCQRAKVIVESYGVSVDERDVSMHSGFLRELKSLTEHGAVVPKLFIRGKYVGGAEKIVELHDDGKLGGLLGGLPLGRKSCEGCGGLHFFPCVKCNGSCKVVVAEGGFEVSRCSDCNENGLIQCPLCSSSSSSSPSQAV